MAFNGTIGRAVLVLDVDGTRVAKGTGDATRNIQQMARSIAQVNRDIAKTATAFSGDRQKQEAARLVAAIDKVGGAHRLTAVEQAKVNAQLTPMIAKYTALGQVAPKAMVDLEKATRGAATTTGNFLTKNVALGSFLGTFGASFAMSAARSLVSFGREIVTNAGNIVDLSAKLGVSTDAVQEFLHVSSQAGIPVEAFSKATYRLGLNLAGGGTSLEAALNRVGLSLKELRALRPEDQFKAVLQALGTITDEGERNRLGNQLLGKSFEQLAGVAGTSYANMARDAKKSSKEQLEALDELGDEVERWKRQMGTFGTDVFGGALKINRQFWERVFPVVDTRPGLEGTAVKFHGDGQGMARINAEAAAAAAKNAQAQQDYAKQLAAVRAELAKLTPQQRTQIDAALELGVSTDDVEQQFGLAAGTLRLYSAQLKDAESASTKLAKSQKELAKETAEANMRWLDILGAIEAARIKEESEFRKLQQPPEPFVAPDVPQTELESLDALKRELDAKEKAAADWRQHMNMIGERQMEDEAERLKRIEEMRERALQPFKDLAQNVANAATSNLFSMLTGLGAGDNGAKQAAKAAREDYERLAHSGKASAEEITRAFRNMRQAEEAAQNKFSDRFRGWLTGIKDAFLRSINEMLSAWVQTFIGGLLRSLAQGLAQKVAAWILGTAGGGSAASGGQGGGGGWIQGFMNAVGRKLIEKFLKDHPGAQPTAPGAQPLPGQPIPGVPFGPPSVGPPGTSFGNTPWGNNPFNPTLFRPTSRAFARAIPPALAPPPVIDAAFAATHGGRQKELLTRLPPTLVFA